MAQSSSSMSPEFAKWLFENGSMLVFIDFPCGSEFGIDLNYWEVGPLFKGVKMIPPGIHFIYYSAVGTDGQVAPRTGFMHDFKPKEVLVKVWDQALEDCNPGSEEVKEKIEGNKEEIDRYLGAYPIESLKKWVSLTNFLTVHLLDYILPLNGKISSAPQLQSVGSTSQSRQLAAADAKVTTENATPSTRQLSSRGYKESDSRLPDMPVIPGTEIRFTEIPRWNLAPTGSAASDITHRGMDYTDVLSSVIKCYPATLTVEQAVLGELQFAFVCFIVGQSFESFDAWKRLLHLVCSCVNAISQYPSLYFQLMSMLTWQLSEIPEDFFVDIVTCNNFLVDVLTRLFDNTEACCEQSSVADVKQRAVKFRQHIEQKFGWDFTAETGEYAPVVVDSC